MEGSQRLRLVTCRVMALKLTHILCISGEGCEWRLFLHAARPCPIGIGGRMRGRDAKALPGVSIILVSMATVSTKRDKHSMMEERLEELGSRNSQTWRDHSRSYCLPAEPVGTDPLSLQLTSTTLRHSPGGGEGDDSFCHGTRDPRPSKAGLAWYDSWSFPR